MMEEAIKNFAKQFNYEPEIENLTRFSKKQKFLLCGLGGSHLAGDILKNIKPDVDLIIHQDYGLPSMSTNDLQDRMIIVSSYSGNTEEVVESYDVARKKNLAILIISTGGRLLEMAKADNVSYIKLPATGIQPRSALGFSFLALLKAVGDEELMKLAKGLSETLAPEDFADHGQVLAEKLKGHIPVVYSSLKNSSIAYNWKIKFNETGKIPAFFNVFPELNHNEMIGFDVKEKTRTLSEKFHFLFLADFNDHKKNQKRMDVAKKLYQNRGFPVEIIKISGDNRLEAVFSSLLLADWTSYYLAQMYSVESESVAMVEEFKQLIL